MANETPEFFNLRPEVEKQYGYTHAVKIGNDIKISGAVSMDDEGNPTAIGDLAQQMKNAYDDLERVLKYYGCTFDDVVVENIFYDRYARVLETVWLSQRDLQKTIPNRFLARRKRIGVAGIYDRDRARSI